MLRLIRISLKIDRQTTQEGVYQETGAMSGELRHNERVSDRMRGL